VLLVVALVVVLAIVPASAHAQQSDRVRQQREELDRLRRERADLEARMRRLRGSVHDLGEEVTIIDRQADATARVVRTLEQQLAAITQDIDVASDSVRSAEQELDHRKGTLRRRLVDIYKRGPLYSYEAMLSSGSFGQLVARYKYLHQLARHDRFLVHRVEELHDQIARQRDVLIRLQSSIEMNRQDKAMEEARLRQLERDRVANLRSAKAAAQRTEFRLATVVRDESRMNSMIVAAIAAERRRADAARASPPGRAASARPTSGSSTGR
jgi:peptidoglycan hydrolase CwlO-like protein